MLAPFLLLLRQLTHLFHDLVLEFNLLSHELVHVAVLVDIEVGGFTAPPFIMGFATRHPLLALSRGVSSGLTSVLFA